MKIKRLIFIVAFAVMFQSAFAQKSTKKYDFKDSLDNKLDISNFLLNPVGFFPFVQPITEPALGSIGVVGGPIFIKPNKHPFEGRYTPPNITAIMAGYSANGTWFTGIFHMGFITKRKLKYTLGAAYASVNLNYYRTFPVIGEQEFGFNFKSIPLFGSILRQVGDSKFFVGLEYVYFSSKITPETENELIAEFVDDKDLNSHLSSPGIVLEYDGRDNIFTPDHGTFLNTSLHANGSWTGSDYDFQNFEFIALNFLKLRENWVSGLRFQADIQSQGAPFYIKPAIQMRGVPAARYQGRQVYVFETEQRYDFSLRWSGVLIGGLAKAIPENETFSGADLVYSYGTGFRYLIARKFKLRVGVDVAWSNDDFGYYIVFGSAWNQRN